VAGSLRQKEGERYRSLHLRYDAKVP
jgi:hypothetical protein